MFIYIIILSLTDPSPDFMSDVLVNVTIDNSTELKLKVTCEFRADVTGQTECVVIWHRRTEDQLYSEDISLPTLIPINEPGEYSVAVFGRQGDGVLEVKPFLTKRVFVKTGMNMFCNKV